MWYLEVQVEEATGPGPVVVVVQEVGRRARSTVGRRDSVHIGTAAAVVVVDVVAEKRVG